MSQYGYTYGAPGGYHPSQPDRPPGNPYAAYNGTTASHPIEADVQPVQVSQHAYDHNHNTIPGLNFGHPEPPANPEHVNSQFHNQVPGLGSSLTSTSVAQAHSQDDANNYSHLPDEEKDVGGEVAGDSELEEGELSEGELEDAYDPRHPQIEPSHPGRGRAYSVSRRSFSDRPPAANTYNAYSRGKSEGTQVIPGLSKLTIFAAGPGGSLLPHHSPRDKHVARPRGSSKERTLGMDPVQDVPSHNFWLIDIYLTYKMQLQRTPPSQFPQLYLRFRTRPHHEFRNLSLLPPLGRTPKTQSSASGHLTCASTTICTRALTEISY